MEANMIPEYAQIPKKVLEDLKKFRNRNPIAACGAQNTNAVFVEIGKNLIVDYILDMYDIATGKTVVKTEAQGATGGDYLKEAKQN